jgi:hypothetical protein
MVGDVIIVKTPRDEDNPIDESEVRALSNVAGKGELKRGVSLERLWPTAHHRFHSSAGPLFEGALPTARRLS